MTPPCKKKNLCQVHPLHAWQGSSSSVSSVCMLTRVDVSCIAGSGSGCGWRGPAGLPAHQPAVHRAAPDRAEQPHDPAAHAAGALILCPACAGVPHSLPCDGDATYGGGCCLQLFLMCKRHWLAAASLGLCTLADSYSSLPVVSIEAARCTLYLEALSTLSGPSGGFDHSGD